MEKEAGARQEEEAPDLIEIQRRERESAFARSGQPLRRDCLIDIRAAECLRWLKINRGRSTFTSNRMFAAVLIRRCVLTVERDTELDRRPGYTEVPVLTRNGKLKLQRSMTLLLDYGLITQENRSQGIYALTHYGDWVCRQWFAIRTDF